MNSRTNLPDTWCVSTLTFLTKPNKPAWDPAHLRPISLLEPCGKIVMHQFGKLLQQQAWPFLCQFPQFAYMLGRGIYEAIRHVFAHCQEVQEGLQTHRHSIHQNAQGTSVELYGGLILSLDLTKAFDRVPRHILYAAMQRVGIDPRLISSLHHIYGRTTCEFIHRGEFRTFETHRGIRQGCSAAPILWAILAACLHR